MFEIGFWELALLAVLSLVLTAWLGPLPPRSDRATGEVVPSGASGNLERIGTYDAGKMAWWVMAVRLPN